MTLRIANWKAEDIRDRKATFFRGDGDGDAIFVVVALVAVVAVVIPSQRIMTTGEYPK